MKSGLFWRTFSAILVVLLVSVLLSTAMLTGVQRQNAEKNYETEVRMQARQVADYLQQLNSLRYIRGNGSIRSMVSRKVTEIYETYNADIWLVNFDANRVEYIDRTWNTSESIATEAVLDQLGMIQSGQEIAVRNLFPTELGERIMTIGVPWKYMNGRVVGAVLLHIPVEKLQVSFWSVLPQALIPAAVSIVLGIVLAFLVARSQTLPIREIDGAVRDFSTGDLTRRVELHCGGELEQLGNSINSMAQELSGLEDSRRSFVANVSHELRSPMTSMKGYVQAMLDGTIGEADRPKYLQIVLDETNRLTDLVRDLLDLSRLESGKFPLEIAPFDANEMMRRILIRFEQRINEKQIDVSVDFAEDPCYALGDVNRINQVVSNFIDNAVKFMSGENSVLTIRTTHIDGKIRFSVQDNGSGIPEADLPHIFDRFYKADKAHTAGMGTGLGLSISRTILQQHASTIEVSSVPGNTVFSFDLAAVEPPQRALPEA